MLLLCWNIMCVNYLYNDWKCIVLVTTVVVLSWKYLSKRFHSMKKRTDDISRENYIESEGPLSRKQIYTGATVTLSGGAERFFAIMNNRRSVRSYSRRAVSLETIESCIRSAGTAPSGAHTEPWTFCLISDVAMKEKIRRIVEDEEYLNYTRRMHRQWVADLTPLQTNHIKPYLTDAPYLILVFKQVHGFLMNGQRKHHYYNEISVSIAIGVLLCALQASGLSSLVTTPLNCGPALRTLLSRPSNEKLVALLPVGHASDDCQVPDLKRKSIEDILIRY